MEDYGFLKFTDESLKVTFPQTLNTMRRHRVFCDVVLNVSASTYKFPNITEQTNKKKINITKIVPNYWRKEPQNAIS